MRNPRGGERKETGPPGTETGEDTSPMIHWEPEEKWVITQGLRSTSVEKGRALAAGIMSKFQKKKKPTREEKGKGKERGERQGYYCAQLRKVPQMCTKGNRGMSEMVQYVGRGGAEKQF